MSISKTEVNLRRLLAAAPQQQNQSKLVHYVATLREQVEQLAEERTPEGLPRVSKAVLSDYSEKIEAIASKLAAPPPDIQAPKEPLARISVKANSSDTGDNQIPPSPGLRRRFGLTSNSEDGTREILSVDDSSAPVKLDAAAQAHIEKHRKLQEDLTDEMVGLARQLKESSLMMNHSLQDTEKILDSTEKAVESSLASTGHANTRATNIYSKTSKTTCFTWLVIPAQPSPTQPTRGAHPTENRMTCRPAGLPLLPNKQSSWLRGAWSKSPKHEASHPLERETHAPRFKEPKKGSEVGLKTFACGH
ncbi:hypothetical protein L3X38_013212 [Prunus dulcis]|uniref:Uncharacterized protein n=1 Tax=Prunus dulcis TaxID=3755 RepID=A0AAD4WKT5_PRUDU|nr:hypothetical protein L3X38_013212 [Prunus dulcis]